MGIDLKQSLSSAQRANILQELQTTHDESRDNQIETRRKSFKVRNYVDGKQYTIGGPKWGAYLGHEDAGATAIDQDVDKEYFISNEMGRSYMVNIQRLTSYFIRASVVPPNKNPSAKVNARAATIMLNEQMRETDVERMKVEIARLLTLDNFACIKTHWDPLAGRQLLQERKGVMSWFLGKESRPEGDCKWDVVGMANLVLPKFAESVEKADWVEEMRIVSTGQAWRLYGKDIKPEVIKADYSNMLLGNRNNIGDRASSLIKDSVLVKERWVRPCAQYQRGARFVWGGNELIRSTNLLDHYPGIPYHSCQLRFDEKDPFGLSILWDLIPLQDFLNLNISAASRYLKMLAMLRLWVPSSTEISEADINNATAMAVLFEGDKKPEWDKTPELNTSIFNLVNMIRDLMSSYGYSNELAKQRRAFSGNALGILQEMDDTIFKPGLESIQSMYGRASNFTLQLRAKHMTVPRMMSMTSMQGWQMAEFKGSMIDETYKAEINLMTGMPSNKVMRLEFLKALYKDGLLSKDEVKNHLEFATDNEALEKVQKQQEIADARVADLLDWAKSYKQEETEEHGLIYICTTQYHDFDNHGLLMVTEQEAMQESFDHWNPWIQMAFLEHWSYHKGKYEEQQLKDAQMAAMGGAGGEPVFPGAKETEGGSGPLAALSNQLASQQPDPSLQPQPMNAGAVMAGGGQNNG